jgi:hypothetical protein
MKEKSIAVIICYMGKLPWYFDYFVHSCIYNPTIDVYVITDDTSYPKRLPANVRIIYKTLADISAIATITLEIPVEIKAPYKLCDFKPAYGVLFPDLIKDYDFWGIGDIDVIFGDIRKFITDEVLDSHDVISVRDDYVTGSFSLFRNNERTNNLFKHSKDYKKVFTSNTHYCFDETNFKHKDFETGLHYSDITCDIESMTHVVRRLEEENYLKAYFDFHIIEGDPGHLRWNNGVMMYRNKWEVMMYHLIVLKDIYKPLVQKARVPDAFAISPRRIYPLKKRVA